MHGHRVEILDACPPGLVGCGDWRNGRRRRRHRGRGRGERGVTGCFFGGKRGDLGSVLSLDDICSRDVRGGWRCRGGVGGKVGLDCRWVVDEGLEGVGVVGVALEGGASCGEGRGRGRESLVVDQIYAGGCGDRGRWWGKR